MCLHFAQHAHKTVCIDRLRVDLAKAMVGSGSRAADGNLRVELDETNISLAGLSMREARLSSVYRKTVDVTEKGILATLTLHDFLVTGIADANSFAQYQRRVDVRGCSFTS